MKSINYDNVQLELSGKIEPVEKRQFTKELELGVNYGKQKIF